MKIFKRWWFKGEGRVRKRERKSKQTQWERERWRRSLGALRSLD